MQIPLAFDPRWYQKDALRALENGVRLAVLCWARRAGKDFTCFGYAVKKMVKDPMNVVLVFPEKEQGRKAFWENVENDGFKTIEHIPKGLILRQDNTEMVITLINGSTFRVLGAKNPDALRGANGKLYIFSEFVDIDSAAYDVIVPIVEVNGGQVIIQSTPKIDGISGATFKRMFDSALTDPEEYASLITAKEYLTDKVLERLERKAIEKNGNNFFFRQEFLCDFGQASATTYYGQVLADLEKRERISEFAYNRAYPVYTAWDLGTSDSTAITFFQYYKKRITIIDYYETHDIGYEPIIRYLATLGYNYRWHFLPHDGSVREQSDATPRLNKLRDLGLVNSSLLKRHSVEDGIRRVVEGLPNVVMNAATTLELVRKLYLYKRKFNNLTGDYLGPDHNTESHAADSVRYLFEAIEQEFNKDTCEMYVTQVSSSQSYESESVNTNFYQPNY